MKFNFLRKFNKIFYYLAVFSLLVQTSGFLGFFHPEKAKACVTGLYLNEFVSNAGQEWVEIYNSSNSTISLEGYKLTDFTSPSGTPILNTMLTLSGEIQPNSVLAFNVSSVLNNSGDSIGLYDATDNELDRVTYGTVTGYTSDITAPNADLSGARMPDGSGWLTNQTATKGTANHPAPISIINLPQNGSVYNESTFPNIISGTATDFPGGTGLTKVEVKIYNNTTSQFYNWLTNDWGAYDPTNSWVEASGTTNWQVNFSSLNLVDSNNYTVFSNAISSVSQASPTQNSFIYDIKPTGTIELNNGTGVTNSLNIVGNFTGSIDATLMKITGDGVADGGNDWQVFNPTRNITLNIGNGYKNIYVEYKDALGNISEKYSAQIYYSDKADNINQYAINPGSNTILQDNIKIIADANNNTKITIANYTSNPESNPSFTAFGKYFDISTEDSSAINFPNVQIRIYFTQNDLNNAVITEFSQIKGLYYWDKTSNSWKLYNNTGISNSSDIGGYIGYVWANVDHFTPMSLGADTVAPNKPANFKSEALDAKVKLTWDEVSDAKGYYVRYKESTNNSNSYTEVYLADKTTKETTINNLKNNTLYEFGIRSIDDAGNKSDWANLTATPSKPSTATTTNSYYSFGATTAYAAENEQNKASDNSKNEKKEEIKTENDVVESEETENETQSARTAVIIGIIIIAIGAALGGYYGYQWWLGEGETEKEVTPVPKPKAEVKPNTETKKKKTNRRW